MTSTDKGVTVTQGDREAAVDILRLSLSNSRERAMLIAEGKLDDDPLVQIFARHRQSAQADAVEIVRVARAALERIEARCKPLPDDTPADDMRDKRQSHAIARTALAKLTDFPACGRG